MRNRARVGVLLAGVLSMGAGCETSISDKDIAKESVVLSLAEVRQLAQARDGEDPSAALFIDPRSPRQFAEGHLPGARNLRLPDAREEDPRDPELGRYDRLVVYGENPGSWVAKAMFKRLLAIGYSGVRFYAGGIDEWVNTGYELETSEPPPSGDDIPLGSDAQNDSR